jgi:hypothetical protein
MWAIKFNPPPICQFQESVFPPPGHFDYPRISESSVSNFTVHFSLLNYFECKFYP